MGTRNYTIDDSLYVSFRLKCLTLGVSGSKKIREFIEEWVAEDFKDRQEDPETKTEESLNTF